jgi:hypothetical protein
MLRLRRILLAFASLSLSVYGEAVQKPDLSVPPAYGDQLQAVKQIFDISYEAYR